MLPDQRFVAQPKTFWANVRSISQTLGYVTRGKAAVRHFSLADIRGAMDVLGLSHSHLITDRRPTPLAETLLAYFEHRADTINNDVQHRLMDVREARSLFEELQRECTPTCPLPRNKQKENKAGPAFLTGIVNMLIEKHSEGYPVNYDPLRLTTVTYNGAPLRTLSRRVDGAFPSPVNPIGIWEIKEYYHTTTFGSRIADGVYETLLDGMELEELHENEGVHVRHLLIADARGTWWSSGGRPYLCRIVDMLHMGYVDEVLLAVKLSNGSRRSWPTGSGCIGKGSSTPFGTCIYSCATRTAIGHSAK